MPIVRRDLRVAPRDRRRGREDRLPERACRRGASDLDVRRDEARRCRSIGLASRDGLWARLFMRRRSLNYGVDRGPKDGREDVVKAV